MPLPGSVEPGGLLDVNVNNLQQRQNFGAQLYFIAEMLGAASDKVAAFTTLASAGGTVGANLGVQGDISCSGDAVIGDDLSVGDNVNANTMSVRQNPGGGVYIAERDSGAIWAIYAAGGTLRVWRDGVGDVLVIDTQGNLTVRGEITRAGL